jgi:BCD family chlorophyll transporter-like MFS transporter
MVILAAGGLTAGFGTGLIVQDFPMGLFICAMGFVGIGVGVSACGTSVLALLAKSVPAARRAPAATVVWLMMIAGFAITAGTAGHFLDPFSMDRLLQVSAWVTGLAVSLTLLATWRLESTARVDRAANRSAPIDSASTTFQQALRSVLDEPAVRQFTVFVFISMLAFSAQDLILEPYAGLVFGYTPGESTQLSGLQHAGVLVGMLLVPLSQLVPGVKRHKGLLRFWTVTGCLVSGAALAGLTIGGMRPQDWPLQLNVFVLGMANGAFSIAAIASMMALAGQGTSQREGTRMGVWGAAQALAFALGGLLGTAMADLAGQWMSQLATAYGSVFLLEALAFLLAAILGGRLSTVDPTTTAPSPYDPAPDHPLRAPPPEETCRA